MIIPDINLLIYAYNEEESSHLAAVDWWKSLLGGSETVGMPWVAISGFIRITTHPRILGSPLHVEVAVKTTRQWLTSNSVQIINPGRKFDDLFFNLLETLGVGGNLTTDAQLAALAIEYQAELHSCDNDFNRFPGLRWRNPLK